MSTRYIFNTAGQYVAFLAGNNLFSPEAQWIGFVRNGNLVYDTNGDFLGHLLDDDRIVRRSNEPRRPRGTKPLRPLTPLRPLKPLKRLRMASLPSGYEDVFAAGASAPLTREDLSTLDKLLNSKLVAADGVFLGMVSNNPFDQASLLNQFGPHGNRYSDKSIFNSYSAYGSEYSPLSPFNPYTTTPPSFLKNGAVIGYLTKNPHQSHRIDTQKFLAWLEKI